MRLGRAYYANQISVGNSDDLERILATPRRMPIDLKSSRAQALVEIMTERLRRPDRPRGAQCGCLELGRRRCIDTLLAPQAWALWEASLVGGLLAPLGVGSGKTLLNILTALVVPDCKVAVLLLPPGLVGQLRNEYLAVREHFIVPSIVLPRDGGFISPGRPVVHVVPYSQFSREESTALLEQLAPDLILADEAHALKDKKSVRTGRVFRYFETHPEARLCCWSGTITSRSILDFAHLSTFALGAASPLPIDPSELHMWAAAIDPSDWKADPGALMRLAESGEDVLKAVSRRILETEGVVSTGSASSCAASIVIRERKPPAIPPRLRTLITDLHKTWTRPDGEEIIEALPLAACARQLACGFYYRWRFPGKPTGDAVESWFAARKAWRKELREKLKNPAPHMDSPKLLKNAAVRYYASADCTHEWATVVEVDEDASTDEDRGEPEEAIRCVHCKRIQGDEKLPTWASEAWPAWRDVKDTIKHETEAVWVDDYLVKDAAVWAAKHRGIVWYDYRAFGQAVAKAAGLSLHGGGANAEARILAERGDKSIVASIKSHGTGRDGLQFYFTEQLVPNPLSDGKGWEQLLGRLHREGQDADEVVTYVYRHTSDMRDAIDKAIGLCKYVEGIMTTNQKLLSANCEWI